jgi:hypothetical protein
MQHSRCIPLISCRSGLEIKRRGFFPCAQDSGRRVESGKWRAHEFLFCLPGADGRAAKYIASHDAALAEFFMLNTQPLRRLIAKSTTRRRRVHLIARCAALHFCCGGSPALTRYSYLSSTIFKSHYTIV